MAELTAAEMTVSCGENQTGPRAGATMMGLRDEGTPGGGPVCSPVIFWPFMKCLSM